MADRLAFQLYSLKEYEGGWEAALAAVKAMGIHTIEAWYGAVPDRPDAGMTIDGLRAALDRAGMKLTCGHVALPEYSSRYEAWVRLLRDYGSADWVIPAVKAESLDEWLAYLPTFRMMAARLHRDGMSLGYHNHHMELAKLGGKYVMEHLLDNLPELKAQFHIGQFLPERGIALADWIRKYTGRICALHVNDATSAGPAPLGRGACRVEESVRAALDAGVETFIMEVRLVRGTLDDVKRDVEFARRLVG